MGKDRKELFVCIFMLCALLLLSGCTLNIQPSKELLEQLAENTEETDEAEANLSKQAQLRDNLIMTLNIDSSAMVQSNQAMDEMTDFAAGIVVEYPETYLIKQRQTSAGDLAKLLTGSDSEDSLLRAYIYDGSLNETQAANAMLQDLNDLKANIKKARDEAVKPNDIYISSLGVTHAEKDGYTIWLLLVQLAEQESI